MLSKLTLENWKSFKAGDRTTIPFATTTLLVGPNASGKSNVLDAIRFLQGCALDLPLDEVLRGHWDGGRQTWTGVRGGAAEAAWAGAQRFAIEATYGIVQRSVAHRIEVTTAPENQLFAERMTDDSGRYLFDTHADAVGGATGVQPGGTITAAYRSVGSGRSASMALRAARSVLSQLQHGDRMKPEVMAATKAVREDLRQMVHLELQPQLMRGPAPLHASRMGASGENVAAVLHQMSTETRGDIRDWLSELCAPHIEDIDFAEVEAVREVYFLLVERGGTRISSRSLSDGTLRFLGILVALLSAPAGATILLEEPDVGLHPARVHLLAEILETVPKRRGVQVIATTHSPVLLAHLSNQTLADVVAFDRDPATGGSIAARAGDLPSFATLRDSSKRDHLIATGWLERAL